MNSADFSELLTASFKVIFAGVAFFVGRKTCFSEKSDRKLFFLFFNFIAISTLSLDLIYRMMSLDFNAGAIVNNFYLAKFNSIIFSDTNGVGIYIAICVSVNIFLYGNSVSKSVWSFSQFILFLLTLFTFSRSAIISILIGLSFFLFLRFSERLSSSSKQLFFITTAMIIAVLMVTFFSSAIDSINHDGSGVTKLKTFLVIPDLIGLDFLKDLFGRGLTEGGSYYSFDSQTKYAHAALPLLLGFFGILGTAIYVLLVILPLFVNNRYLVVFVIFMLMGFSYLEVLLEGLFLVVGLSVNSSLIRSYDRTLYRV
ncbi:MAG: hypothetical protein ACTH36_09325 [Pseudoalteromonas nigrifaciens]